MSECCIKVESIAHNSSTAEICLNFVPWVINGSTDQPKRPAKKDILFTHRPLGIDCSGQDGTAVMGQLSRVFFFLGFALVARMKVSILMDSEEGNPRARWFPERVRNFEDVVVVERVLRFSHAANAGVDTNWVSWSDFDRWTWTYLWLGFAHVEEL